jgi:excisionase family DNA binding protein
MGDASSVGKPRSARAGSWCVMASNPPGDALSEISFLTVAEVATAMRVSKMTVYRLVHAGDLPAVRVGRSFRVPEDAVNEYLRKSYFQAG